MWVYSQITGNLFNAQGSLVGSGYSGYGAGLNNPDFQAVEDVGPIPQGLYTIGPFYSDSQKGPLVSNLTPDEQNKMFGRDGFMIHGDDVLHLGAHIASHGCIVMAHEVRLAVSRSGDNRLAVTS